MELTRGDALLILNHKTNSSEDKLRAMSVIFDEDPKLVYGRLTKMDLWELSKFLYEEIINGYDDIVITEANPCYHCYQGAINRCMGCEFSREEWSKQLESPYYTKVIKFREISNKILE